MNGYGPFEEMIAEVERELADWRFARMQRLGLFQPEGAGAGLRAWAAARLMSLALRLDRRSGERVAEQLSLRHA